MQLGPPEPQWPVLPLDQLSSPLSPLRNSQPAVFHHSPSKFRTASEVLAAFSPKRQPKKSPSQQSVSPQAFPLKMETKRGLRNKVQISYEISSDSEGAGGSPAPDSTFSSPEKPSRHIIDLEDEIDVEEIESPGTPPARLSTAGHALRQHKDLHLSLRAQENGDKRVGRKTKRCRPASKRSKTILGPVPKTARNEIRDQIATETASKRANFLIAKQDLFLPLLPQGNYIQRLASQHTGTSDLSIPYEVLREQPKG